MADDDDDIITTCHVIFSEKAFKPHLELHNYSSIFINLNLKFQNIFYLLLWDHVCHLHDRRTSKFASHNILQSFGRGRGCC